MVIDDYAHHPSEIKATLETARDLYDRRVIVIYQPHLYSRTRDFKEQFAESLAITHGDEGIKVSVICPQAVATQMLGDVKSGPQIVDGILKPERMVDSVIAGLAEETFLILPHEKVHLYMERKTSDYDRWLKGMRRFRRSFLE